MEKIKTKEQLKALAEKHTEEALEELFKKVHKEVGSVSGEINGDQMDELDEIQSRLTSLVTDQVWQNLVAANLV